MILSTRVVYIWKRFRNLFPLNYTAVDCNGISNVFGTQGGKFSLLTTFLLIKKKGEFELPITNYIPKYGTQGWTLGIPLM